MEPYCFGPMCYLLVTPTGVPPAVWRHGVLGDSVIVKTTEYKPTSFRLSAASPPVGLRISLVDHPGPKRQPRVPSTAQPPFADRKALGGCVLAMGKAGPPDDHRPNGVFYFFRFS